MYKLLLQAFHLRRRTLGMEITDEEIRLAEMIDYGKGKRKITACAKTQLPRGIVADGKLMDGARLQDALRQLLEDADIRTKHVHLAIPSQAVIIRTLQLPDVPRNELKKLIHYEMKENLQAAMDEPYFDFVKLPERCANPRLQELPNTKAEGEGEEQAGSLREVLVVASSLRVLNDFTGFLKALRLIPVSIEISAFSLIRMLEKGPFDTDGVNLIVHINESSSEITVMEEGVLKLTRNFDASFGEPSYRLGDWQEDHQAYSSRAAVQDLLSEVERLMNFYYYTFNKETSPFLRIYVSGGGMLLERIASEMKERFTQTVVSMDWEQLRLGSPETLQIPSYAAAIGLALRGGE